MGDELSIEKRASLVPSEDRISAIVNHALSEAGVTPQLLQRSVSRISDALDAQKTRRMKNEEQKIVEFNDVDHSTRLNAARDAIELAARAGLIPAPPSVKKPESEPQPITVNINILNSDGEKTTVKVFAE